LGLMRPKTAPPQHLVAPLKLLIVLSNHIDPAARRSGSHLVVTI
jgi:hypothetical protein